MKQKYNLSISEDSQWLITTPSEAAKRMPFFVLEYGHFLSYKDYFTERTGKKAYYLLYTAAGRGFLKTQYGELTTLPGTAVLINCEKYQFYKTASEEPWDNYWLHFNGRAAKEFFSIINGDEPMLYAVGERDYFTGLMTGMKDFFEVGDIRTNVAASLQLTKILSYLISLKFQSAGSEPGAGSFDIEKTIAYMKQHYLEKLTVDRLAKNAMLSKYYFIRQFGAVTGTSPYSYLMNLRINAAKELLVTTDMPVTAISSAAGFNNYNNFIKAFKKTAGVTPAAYKKLL